MFVVLIIVVSANCADNENALNSPFDVYIAGMESIYRILYIHHYVKCVSLHMGDDWNVRNRCDAFGAYIVT